MNRYKTYADFLGTDDPLQLQPNTDGWLPLAREIRGRLGDKAYLLDSYLSQVFQGLYHVKAENAVAAGDKAATLLWLAIRYAMAGDVASGKQNPFYEQAKAYIDEHPLPYQEESTRYNIYYVALANILPLHQLSQYLSEDRPSTIRLDVVRLRELYREIGMLLEDFDPMNKLGASIRASFQITDAAHMFMQGTVDALLFSLTYRDEETSRQVFQLILE